MKFLIKLFLFFLQNFSAFQVFLCRVQVLLRLQENEFWLSTFFSVGSSYKKQSDWSYLANNNEKEFFATKQMWVSDTKLKWIFADISVSIKFTTSMYDTAKFATVNFAITKSFTCTQFTTWISFSKPHQCNKININLKKNCCSIIKLRSFLFWTRTNRRKY